MLPAQSNLNDWNFRSWLSLPTPLALSLSKKSFAFPPAPNREVCASRKGTEFIKNNIVLTISNIQSIDILDVVSTLFFFSYL